MGNESASSILHPCCNWLCHGWQRIQRQTLNESLGSWRPKSNGFSDQGVFKRECVVQVLHAGNFVNGYNIFSEVLEASENPVSGIDHEMAELDGGPPRSNACGKRRRDLPEGPQ